MSPTTFKSIVSKSIAAHTLTYFLVGLAAYSLFDYSTGLNDPAVSALMRPADDPLVQAGVLFQPIRGLLFGIVLYLLRDCLFPKKNGWLVLWATLVVVGIWSTYGPAPGSIEGLIYTRMSFSGLSGGGIEVLAQSLLYALLTHTWVNHPGKKWLSVLIWAAFFLAMALPALGLLALQLSS
jgi:hypothetical protein